MHKALLVVLLVANTAHADECNKYLDAYNAAPERPDNDQVLYNAGACFADHKAIGGALQSWQLLLKYYPSSKLAEKALARTALAYERIAQYDQAAASYEQYAKKYAGEKDARDAIEDAIVMRAAIGDTAKRIEDTKYFVQTFGAKAPKETADAMFTLVGAYEAPDDQVKALREYIRTYGSKTDREKLAIAYGRIGDALWRKSCPAVPIDGLCVKIVRDQTPRCSATMPVVATVTRAAGVRKEALAAYDQAIKIVEDSGFKDAGSLHVTAMARVARADDDLERMIAQTFPTGLDFSGPGKQRSMKRFDDWLAAETKRGAALNVAYEQVLQIKDPTGSIAAAARLGQLTEAFARAMMAGEIPKDVRTGDFAKDKSKAYCDTLDQAAAPLRARAVEAFGVCANKAVELGVIDDWIDVCRRDGALLDPKSFPPRESQPPLEFAIPIGKGTIDEWKDALAKNGKLFAPHVNIAIAEYEQARALPGADAKRKQLAGDAEFHAANALALDSDPLPFVVLAALAADSGDKRKLVLARAYLDQAILIDDKNPTVLAARAVVAARQNQWTLALSIAERAVTLAPKSDAALRVAGIVGVRAGQLDAARTRLAAVKPQTYDVLVARGIAARGLGDAHAAESFYRQAIQLDPARKEAHDDLDLLRRP